MSLHTCKQKERKVKSQKFVAYNLFKRFDNVNRNAAISKGLYKSVKQLGIQGASAEVTERKERENTPLKKTQTKFWHTSNCFIRL